MSKDPAVKRRLFSREYANLVRWMTVLEDQTGPWTDATEDMFDELIARIDDGMNNKTTTTAELGRLLREFKAKLAMIEHIA